MNCFHPNLRIIGLSLVGWPLNTDCHSLECLNKGHFQNYAGGYIGYRRPLCVEALIPSKTLPGCFLVAPQMNTLPHCRRSSMQA